MAQIQVSQNRLILYLLMLVGLVLGYTQYFQRSSDLSTLVSSPLKSNLDDFRGSKIDFSIFNSEQYRSLRVFGELEVNPGATGRQDIFAPF